MHAVGASDERSCTLIICVIFTHSLDRQGAGAKHADDYDDDALTKLSWIHLHSLHGIILRAKNDPAPLFHRFAQPGQGAGAEHVDDALR